ncbi:MAG: dephospho-CoA kinase [Candidatus Marinimicrobia bacterium]|jgi:dephospho-CoA kinase|nr:dephospho-CoA kinase [Candidatus Neomarinimicrobiota bacterium]MDP6789098.1 dephospho-CoA kinase [Candidatus Neomarinimicrobiota bacterium]MDP7072500.1 dephospho-CoA kinase [Candidatus Neomarinimicrobiota bacterium]
MLRLGVTGGIGSGKSTASKILEKKGAYIFDADTEAKRLLNENPQVQNELIAEFGTDILGPGNVIDKKKLARVAFQDSDHQSRLNIVIHPFVFEDIDAAYRKVEKKKSHPLFVVDGAMIFESGFDQHLDYVIIVTAQLKIRLSRALERGTLTRDEILKRMDLQWTDDEKIGMADFAVFNESSEEELEAQITDIFDQLV